MDLAFVKPSDMRQRLSTLDEKRSKIGLSVAELCRKADVSEATFHSLMRDAKREPHFRTINKLEAALRKIEGSFQA